MPEADTHIPAIIATSGARIPLAKSVPPEPSSALSVYPNMADILGRPNLAMLRRLSKSPWVRAAIRCRREQVSSAEWGIVPIDAQRPYDEAFARQAEELLRHPNPLRDSFRTLIEPVVEDYLVCGQGAIEKELTARRTPRYLYAVNGGNVRFEPGWTGKDPSAPRYYYYSGGTKIPLRNDELIVFLSDPATDRLEGLSTLAVLAVAVEAELAGSNWAHDHMRQMPPSGVLDLGPGVSDKQVRDFRAYWQGAVAGRSLAILGGSEGAKYIPFSTQSGADLLAWNEYFVRKICAAFRISPQDLGVTFDINRATADAQSDISRDSGLKPLLQLIEEYLNREWLADFGKPADNLAFRFTALSETDQVGVAELINLQAPNLPRLTLNEARVKEGLDPLEGGDVILAVTTRGVVPIIGEGVPTPAEQYAAQQAAQAGQQAAAGDANTPRNPPAGDGPAQPDDAALPQESEPAPPKTLRPALRKAAAPRYPPTLAPARRALRRGYASYAAARNTAILADVRARLGLVRDATGHVTRRDLLLAVLWAIERAIVAERLDASLTALIRQAWLDSAAQRITDELERLGRTQAVTLSDPGLLAAINQRARAAADAISRTLLADARTHFDAAGAPDEYDDGEAAVAAASDWLTARDAWKAGEIANSETQAASLFALRQFSARNGLEGRARCVPTDAACDTCGGFIDQGSVPLDVALAWDLPAHPRCPHDIETDYDPLEDGDVLWIG